MGTHQRIPLVPDPDAANRAFVRSFTRAAVCSMRSAIDGTQTAETYARKAYPDDSDVPRLLRAAVAPHTTTDSASNLVAQSMALLDALMPVSASAGLLRETAGVLGWDPGVGVVSVPTLDMTAALPTWIVENQPYPIPQGVSTALHLKPHKWGTGITFTREMLRHSQADIMAQQSMTAGIGYALDQSLFSANAAVPGQTPAGLLNGLTALSPSTAGFGLFDALVADLSALASAVSMVAVNGPIVFVCSPAQARSVKIYRPQLEDSVLASAALPDKTAIAVATASLAFCAGSPTYDPSHEGTVDMSTTPQPAGSPGSPPVVAPNLTSAWQADLVIFKFRWELDWGLRTKPAQPNGPPPGVAFMQNVNW
jgi:hypothetical protein